MKTIFKLVAGLFLVLSFHLNAQEYIASPVRLSKVAIGQVYSVSSDNAVLKLNEQNNQFSFTIRLFPILTSMNESDSIASLNRKIVMSYTADFPINDLDFFDAGNNGKQYTMDGEMTVNGITKPVRINFFLQGSIAHDISSRDLHSYPARISFAVDINPAEYALDMETAKFTEKIIVLMENGIINRPSAGSGE